MASIRLFATFALVLVLVVATCEAMTRREMAAFCSSSVFSLERNARLCKSACETKGATYSNRQKKVGGRRLCCCNQIEAEDDSEST